MTTVAHLSHRYADVDGVRVFYRETGPAHGLPLLLLHGFPSASHQFRRLMDALGTRFRLIAPDYPGFGHTEAPEGFTYSFDGLADVMDGFVEKLGLDRFVLYVFDFGGPVGLRLAARNPSRIAGLIVQNANAYEEGLSALAKETIAAPADRLGDLFTLPVTRGQYEDGAGDTERMAPDGWTLDQHFLDLPGRREAQLALALDYKSNVALYPQWQQWLRDHRPPTLILWGTGDRIFPPAGAHAYLRDLPDAELHLFDTGHFALEESLPEIAPLIAGFLTRRSRLRLAVIGATGHLGGIIAGEASARGHQVTPLHRPAVDVTDPRSITRAVHGHDAVIVAVKGPDRLVPRAAEALLRGLPEAGVPRLLFVGGGGSLEYAPGLRFIDSPDFPPQYLETARDQAEALTILRTATTPVAWTYASPPPLHLTPGPRTNTHRTAAGDTPLTDADGESRITTGDYAAAIVDAVEHHTYIRERFTAAY
ncbi:Haloalkane dehalogenase [Streptomyces sp. RB5]|uniref:Haloalkane dehalogenase n=1 Tax=Streptomyces smaragdinus TaxID=2585196 RepID=A0A7K0CRV3_9ACTN|nr:alpha/beta fold hydrolase [Streptomyces smaragdinus]MQY16171.1 Haloalkane dehalogenase [Streptomyces smaragdinus]